MLDTTLITSLGVPGFALWILWMSYKAFMQRMKEKDEEQAAERSEFARRMDAKEQITGKLNEDIRNSLATALVESSNILKQAMAHMSKKS